jgi:hypothetical protein
METAVLRYATVAVYLLGVTSYSPMGYDLPITVLLYDCYQSFGEAFCLNLQGVPRKMWTLQALPKHRQLITNQNGLIFLYYHLVNALSGRTVDLKLNFVQFSDCVLQALFSSL